MTVRQAGVPITDEDLRDAAVQGGRKHMEYLHSSSNKDGPLQHDSQCRLYPKLSFFFDGTGNNLEIDTSLLCLSNVAELDNAAANDQPRQGASSTYLSGVGTPSRCLNLWAIPTRCKAVSKLVAVRVIFKRDPQGDLAVADCNSPFFHGNRPAWI